MHLEGNPVWRGAKSAISLDSQYLVLTITLVFCLTIVAPALRAQGPLPVQPGIALDFAQYCIGDSWKFRLSNGVVNTSVRLLGNSNGQSWEIANWGRTDAAG